MKMVQNIVAVGLAASFLALAENKDFVKDKIEGLGEVGIKKLSLAERDAWLNAADDSTAILIQGTVCDPETGELTLKSLTKEQIKGIPAPIADELVKKIYKHNGIKTVAEVQAEKEAGQEPTELKNSDPTEA
ncbi:hypothetical protein ACX1NY_11225 [Acinetobacter sp. ANC 4631]